MNPPIVYDVSKPSSQRTIRTIAIVCSKSCSLCRRRFARARNVVARVVGLCGGSLPSTAGRRCTLAHLVEILQSSASRRAATLALADSRFERASAPTNSGL